MVLTRHTVVQEGTEGLPREAKMGRRDCRQAGEWGSQVGYSRKLEVCNSSKYGFMGLEKVRLN